MKMVTVKSVEGDKETNCLAEFLYPVSGNNVAFLVTRSLDAQHDVVTHQASGRMICRIDYLDSTMLEAEEAGRKTLTKFIDRIGEETFSARISCRD